MRSAERWALPAILIGALALRLWGIHHGLPYAFNVDEGAHFVPRAIGMFGHSLNPQYFVNPPAFTYLLHFAFWARWGSTEAVGGAFAADPSTAFTIARVLAALLGVAAVGLLAWAGARLFDRRVGLVAAALLAVAFLRGALLAPRGQRHAGAGAAVPEPRRRGGRVSRRPAARLRARRRRARGGVRDQVHGRDRAAVPARRCEILA